MKKIKRFAVLAVVAALAVFACKKDDHNLANSKTVTITEADKGKTVSILQGQNIALALSNPGDGGYDFDTPEYDSSVLLIADHTHAASTNLSLVGGEGKDTWQFTPLHAGTTNVKITATRHWAGGGTVTIFSGNIVVK